MTRDGLVWPYYSLHVSELIGQRVTFSGVRAIAWSEQADNTTEVLLSTQAIRVALDVKLNL
jgi:hypothetical protein